MQLLNYLTYDGVCYILTKSKKSVIIEVAKDFQINIKTITYSCIEAETTNIIKKTFNGEEILDQYNVNGYKLDLYFPKYNLAIECDERLHLQLQHQLYDIGREEYIKSQIGCSFIRYNPDAKDFDIYQLLNDIFKHIKHL